MSSFQGIVGVVHLPAMPGDPDGLGFPGVRDAALRDAEALAEGGVDGIIIENFGSSPFFKEAIPPHQVACLALLGREIKETWGLRTGVNCLRNDARAAVGIAAAAGLDFVRVNVHVGAAVTDQGIIEGRAAETLRYREALEARKVAIWADVLVKHAAPLGNSDPAEATRETLERGRADAVIVTGRRTGGPIDTATLTAVRAAAGPRPVLLGSGVGPEDAERAALADGAIVGTWLKEKGDVTRPVDPNRVRRLVEALGGAFRGGGPDGD